ncbi:GGDEF domain-containing protein [Halomonas campisalis]|uniref:diguanylate cyclase n=1 Tax=Billgrantia campisalis TaxID=74661 RepID=A0ABS9P826_9GAMM|nr:GGDEF domain-containing protein [Halomonas campisalis]MCG6657925.1 GGDEF domain-containing protein [Halomonas campisalis]MDR5863550.1 GGDEF domain-containing protein [Halomonas campisalis]
MAAGTTDTADTKTASALDWRAEFRDPAREALFRRTMQSHDACQMRVAFSVVAALFLAFSLNDYSLVGSDAPFPALLVMHLTVAAVCLPAAWSVWNRPALAHRLLPVNLVCLVGISGLLLAIPLKPDSTGIHLASMVVASMVLYLFVPNRLPWLLGWNAYLFVGFVVATWLWVTVPPGMMATSLLLLGFVNLLGWLTVTRLSRLQRMQFASLLEEREANRQLHAEIAERTQLEEQLRQMASTDELTGIANRRYFFELAERELRRARRDDSPLAICMVDIDLFKNLNDRHGHAVGDRVLTAVAACCQSVLRETDIIGRYGGEEFVIALPQANLQTATAIAERLREKVARLSLPMVGDEERLSVTVGISLIEKDEVRLDDALQRADKALYDGKARGRNCVVVSRQDPPLSAVTF